MEQPTLERMLSCRSESRLDTLDELDGALSHLEEELNAVAGSVGAADARGHLATIGGLLDKLQFEQVDAVSTVDLDSGQLTARDRRKALNGRVDVLRGRLATLVDEAAALKPTVLAKTQKFSVLSVGPGAAGPTEEAPPLTVAALASSPTMTLSSPTTTTKRSRRMSDVSETLRVRFSLTGNQAVDSPENLRVFADMPEEAERGIAASSRPVMSPVPPAKNTPPPPTTTTTTTTTTTKSHKDEGTEAGWVEYTDPETRCPYWFNPTDGRSSWEMPPEVAAARASDDDWGEHVGGAAASAGVTARDVAQLREEVEFNRGVQKKLVTIASQLHERCAQCELQDADYRTEVAVLKDRIADLEHLVQKLAEALIGEAQARRTTPAQKNARSFGPAAVSPSSSSSSSSSSYPPPGAVVIPGTDGPYFSSSPGDKVFDDADSETVDAALAAKMRAENERLFG